MSFEEEMIPEIEPLLDDQETPVVPDLSRHQRCDSGSIHFHGRCAGDDEESVHLK